MDFTFEQLAAFVRKQRNTKRINMKSNYFDLPVGCVLVQFGRKMIPKEKIKENAGAGWSDFSGVGREIDVIPKEKTHNFITTCIEKKITTFGQAKKILAKFV